MVTVVFIKSGIDYLHDPFSQTENLDIYWIVFLAAVFKMMFTSILNILIILRHSELQQK